MFEIRKVAIFLCTTILVACASSLTPGNDYATITVGDLYGGFNKNISISSVDGSSTGTLFQPKTVQVKPGSHTIVQNVFCNGCAYDGKHSFVIDVEAGHTYFLPKQFSSRVIKR
ncbi:MAG: hypothetical protein KJ899_08910 [Gammaproteobacteria bacterium]|nr:hypothetical protein [Gammaproteobacteria bacterium]